MAEYVDIFSFVVTLGVAIATALVIVICGGTLAMSLATLLADGLEEACYFIAEKVRQRRRK